ncbi:MAG: 23S rRNA (uracil(1939)-C(5))-methyltransferase RlmD [Chlamydiae bacterium]|nr:23S rRNA (uracil(1939)-C(5))-methyltransferase RlmD [Chlamydiota bacterium]MBI3265877.1 23S rRNA (uracil(1939)-C(5))-methyltransferase RlmD [Chlamydiota bacterium]
METRLKRYAVSDLIELKVDSVAFGGEAVGRLDGLVVFVDGAIDGEKVQAEIVQVKKKYLKARLLKILEPSPFRVKPPCKVFGECGGCQYQHMDYAHQLSVKEAQVREILERIGRLKNFEMDPIKASPHPYGYRTRVDFHLVNEESFKMGFIDQGGRDIVDVEECPISSPAINRSYQNLRDEIRGGRAQLPLWTQEIKFWDVEEGVHYFPLGHEGQVDLQGRSFLKIKIRDRVFQVHPLSFFQVNVEMIPGLVDCVEDFLELEGNEFLLDCYSGVGLFTVFLGARVRRSWGVEWDPEAVRVARINAQINGLRNCEFWQGSTEKFFKKAKATLPEKVDRVILDPTRAGCHKTVLESLIALGVPRMVYVSCNPTTLARDLAFLCQNGYQLERVQPLDLFPQTRHCEVVVSLKK